MSLPVTYQYIINRVANWLENNCINSYTKWGSCPAWCKNGYRTAYVFFAGTNAGLKGSRFRYVLQNGIANGLGQNAILNQLNSYVDSKGANRAKNVPDGEIIDFMLLLGQFIAAHVYFMGNFNSDDPDSISNGTAKVSRTKNTTTYLVYKTTESGVPMLNIDLSSLNEYKILEAADINRAFTSAMTIINNSLRCISAQYTIQLAST